MEQVVIKTEVQNNGEILLFYVDENGGTEQSVLTKIENIENSGIDLQNINPYSAEVQFDDTPFEINQHELTFAQETWTEDEVHRLLVFYNDNKQAFLTGSTKRIHLWTIACKTMIFTKNPTLCDTKLNSLKDTYIEVCKTRTHQGLSMEIIDLCHQAFGDDPEIYALLNQEENEPESIGIEENFVPKPSSRADEKVEKLLQLYIKYKRQFQGENYSKMPVGLQRLLWDKIAKDIGEEDGIFWRKRFFNFKQHYVGLLEKRLQGIDEINWPYMTLFDEIYKDDVEFNKKHNLSTKTTETVKNRDDHWFETEKVVLIKHQYDCFDDFQDPKIPKGFLWNEIGRLLDKPAEICKKKVAELKMKHYNSYLANNYNLNSRKPLQILLDNVISKEIEYDILKSKNYDNEGWRSDEIDEMVQFVNKNTDLFKDPICFFVCFGVMAKKMKRSPISVREKWQDLVTLYKIIMEDKKENPDMQIDWKYIEQFDSIFDYGTDTKLMQGYEKNIISYDKGFKKEKAEKRKSGNNTDYDSSEETITKKSKHLGESKAFQILEYYLKNKLKFLKTNNKTKNDLWNVLARQIGITATQCAHRFRNLKQVYTAYLQREINKPEMPIMWPYYALCKKVFGYRAMKNKLKNGKNDSDVEDWSAKEIKALINYFSSNFHDISNNSSDESYWQELGNEINKSSVSCRDKFLELRKSYRKLKTQITRNPSVKISWKYYKMFEEIYSFNSDEMNQDEAGQAEEDYECIIVLPEGSDLSDIQHIDGSQVIIQESSRNNEDNEETIQHIEQEVNEIGGTDSMDASITSENSEMVSVPIDIQAILEGKDETQNTEKKIIRKWTIKSKKRLLILYINYVRSHKGKEINRTDMWQDIGQKLERRPIICKKMLAKIKKRYLKSDHDKTKDPLRRLLEILLKLKPKFVKNKVYNDVAIPVDKVTKALDYYMQYIEDFSNPKFDKRFLWTELANYISEPVKKIMNKINYLKQAYNDDFITEENAQFVETLKEIIAKEIAINLVTEIEVKSNMAYEDSLWSEEEIEKLLEWYLSMLDKFKHPKYVRSYLWKEASELLKRSPLDCSRKMSEIRSQYRSLVKENSPELQSWKFFDFCQKIYGTGKKNIDS